MGLLQIATSAILQIATSLLQIAIGIINCDEHYCKLQQVLQIATVQRFLGEKRGKNRY